MKKMKSLLAILLCMILVGGCGGKKIDTDTNDSSNDKEQAAPDDSTDTSDEETDTAETIKVGLIVGTGGLGDQNFNDLAYSGLEQAQELYGIEFDCSEPQAVADYATYISQYAEDGSYDLIMVNASEGETALEELAPQYPDQKFTIIDTQIDEDNIMSLVKDFRDYTFLGGYVAGALTADTSLDRMNEQLDIGLVIGVDSPVMQEGALGYIAGAKLANPDVEVRVGIAGAFNDPAAAKEITKSMYDGGADIVMALAGSSGLGVLNQAKESDLYAIGCAVNQNDIAPDNIIASEIENLDVAVVQIVEKLINGDWTGGPELLSIKSGYFELVYEDSNIETPQDLKDKLAEVYADIQDGKLELPETKEDVDSWAADNAGYAY